MNQPPLLGEVTRRLVITQLGTSRTPDELASATVHVVTTLLATLAPLLGQAGSLALFRRSVRLAESIVPFYHTLRAAEQENFLNAVGACIHQQPLDVAKEAVGTLLTAYIELLANFIGERLTQQLLQEAWPDLGTFTSQETEE
jgi:hypothetical protein